MGVCGSDEAVQEVVQGPKAIGRALRVTPHFFYGLRQRPMSTAERPLSYYAAPPNQDAGTRSLSWLGVTKLAMGARLIWTKRFAGIGNPPYKAIRLQGNA
jgi:hypothetical protein